MTLHILFITIMIKRREYSPEELISLLHAKQIREENREYKLNYFRQF